MSSYGRNFEFRIPPYPNQRNARYKTPVDASIPIGAPVEVVDTTTDLDGRLEVVLATGATVPRNGLTGIMVYEWAPSWSAGTDPLLTTYSDMDLAPMGAPVQLVSGGEVKVCLRNTVARSFYGQRDYAGRLVVAPAGLSGVTVGDYLHPGTGSDVAGYWAVTATLAEAWLIVTAVDVARGEVEARMTY